MCLFVLGPVPRDQGVLRVLEYVANYIDFESCVSQALDYLLELSKTEEGLHLDPKGKKLIAMAMKNNMTDKNIQITGCNVLNSLVIAGLYSYTSGPSCSKLTTSLVNDSLKFTLSDTQIC